MEEKEIIKKYIRIPLFIIEQTLKETKAINKLRLFLYLSSHSNGHFRFERGERTFIAKELGVTRQCLDDNLNRLIQQNWIGYNTAKDLYHVRGFRSIKIQERIKGRQAVEINVEKELKNRKAFEALIWGAYIGNFVRVQQRKVERKQREEYHKGRSKQKRSKRKTFFPVAVSVIEQCLGVSRSTACKGRELAVEYGYLDVKKPFKLICPFEAKARFYEGGKASNSIRRIDGKFFIQETHLLRPQNLQYCRMPRIRKKTVQKVFPTYSSSLSSPTVESAIPFL